MNSCDLKLKRESGIQMLMRLGAKPSLAQLEPRLFPVGLKAKDIIEFYGEEGTGKTQCLLHLICNCIIPDQWRGLPLGGLGVAVLYIDTDYHLPMVRLISILEHRVNGVIEDTRSSDSSQISPTEEEVEQLIKSCLARLYVIHAGSSTQLLLTLHSLESFLSNKLDLCLLMIDSISAFYWIDKRAGGDSIATQESNNRKISQILLKLATNFKLAVIATKAAIFQKKTADKFDNPSRSKNEWSRDHSEYLSRAWQRLVSERMTFEKSACVHLAGLSSSQATHTFMVSSDREPVKLKFTIGDKGIEFK